MERALVICLLRSETDACYSAVRENENDKISKTNLREVVGRFTHQRMDEISTAESTCDKGIYIAPIRGPDCHILSNVGEHVGVAEGN